MRNRRVFIKPGETITTYSMQKVGSSTVMKACEEAGYPVHRGYDANIKSLPYKGAVITLVRDPIARNISWYWENILMNGEKKPELLEDFSYPLEWFDVHFREIIGTNVYTDPFYKGKGWRIYAGGRVLIVQMERLNDVLPDALSAFFEVPAGNFSVSHEAKGVDRFGEEYVKFANTIKYNFQFLKSLYFHTKYCNHFYDRVMRREFIQRWRMKSRK